MIIRVDDRTAIYGEKQMTWKGSCGKMVIAAEGYEAAAGGGYDASGMEKML